MFNIQDYYNYSIPKARELYRDIHSNEQTFEVVKKNIIAFLHDIADQIEFSESTTQYWNISKYSAGGQSVELWHKNGCPESIHLYQNEPHTEELLNYAYYNKSLFGLPVFSMTVMVDSPLAFLGIMSFDVYKRLDNPESIAYQKVTNYLDDIIKKYGGNDNW